MKAFASVLSALALTAGWAAASLAEEPTESSPTTMQARCFDRGELLFTLATEHGERLSQTRRVGNEGLLEAFKSPTDGTWTIVYSNSPNLSCIIAEGEGLPADEDDAAANPEFAV